MTIELPVFVIVLVSLGAIASGTAAIFKYWVTPAYREVIKAVAFVGETHALLEVQLINGDVHVPLVEQLQGVADLTQANRDHLIKIDDRMERGELKFVGIETKLSGIEARLEQ